MVIEFVFLARSVTENPTRFPMVRAWPTLMATQRANWTTVSGEATPTALLQHRRRARARTPALVRTDLLGQPRGQQAQLWLLLQDLERGAKRTQRLSCPTACCGSTAKQANSWSPIASSMASIAGWRGFAWRAGPRIVVAKVGRLGYCLHGLRARTSTKLRSIMFMASCPLSKHASSIATVIGQRQVCNI